MSGVVGLDPSLTSTGLAFTNKDGAIDWHNIKSKGKKGDTLEMRRERLYAIANEIDDWVWGQNPDLVVIEGPSYGSSFGSPHDRSGLWWIVVNGLRACDIPVVEVAPQCRAKYGSGAGNSKKDVVFAHVIERYTDIAGRKIPNHDVGDAILLASMGARRLGFPIDGDLPANNLTSIDAVAWPVV